MLKAARPTNLSNRAVNRALLACGLALLIGIPAITIIYWNDRHIASAPSIVDQTIAAAEAAVRADPEDLAARDHLAAAYVSAHRYQDGIDQFTVVLNTDAGDRAALLGRAIAYQQVGKLDAAATDLQTFIADNSTGEMAKTDPQLEHAYYVLGVVQLAQGQAGVAAATLQKALAIDGSDADALYSLGSALIQTGDDQEAVSSLKLAVSFVPTGWRDPYQALADAYKGLGSADGVAWANAMVAFCDGQLDQAEAALQPLTGGTMKIDALIGLGYVAAQRGDNATAAGYFRQVLQVDPTNASASIALSLVGAASPAAASPTPTTGD